MRHTFLLLLMTLLSRAYPRADFTFLNPCPHIHSLINIATAEPNLSQSDHTVSGIQPISVSRAYRQCEGRDGPFYYWDLLGDRILVYTAKKQRNIEVVLHEASGRSLVCAKPESWFAHKGTEGEWSAAISLDTAHNLMGEELGAQTNVANIELRHSFAPGGPTFVYTDGSGERRTYTCFAPQKHRRKRKHGSVEEYRLMEVTKPNGNRLVYFYNEDHSLHRIEAQNSTGSHVMGWVKYRKGVLRWHTTDWGREFHADSYGTAISSSDCWWIAYTEQLHISGGGEEIWNPYQIEMPGLKERLYFGSWGSQLPFRVDKRSWGHEHTLQYGYNNRGQLGVVKAPVSSDGTLQTIASILYQNGKRTVMLPHDTAVSYEFGKGGRPLCRHAEGLFEHYVWHGDGPSERIPRTVKWRSPPEIDPRQLDASTNNRLYAHVLTDEHRHVHVAQLYDYDARGNVLTETLTGTLTGRHSHSLVLEEDNSLQVGDADSYVTHRTYSEDGFNLVLTETDGDTSVHYSYKPGTNLLISKLTLAGDTIVLREFFEYDDCAVVVSHICDDGCSADPSDLTNVMTRTMTRTTPRYQYPAFGLPKEIQEWYWEPNTQEEALLNSSHFTYTKYGRLATADTNGAVSRFFYDTAGHLIQKESPGGFSTHYDYDENGNCINKWTDNVEGKTTYTYDLTDRMIAKTESDGLTWQYAYDSVGNLLCETDPHGHRTELTYDTLSRVTSRTGRPIRDRDQKWWRPVTTYEYDPLGNITCETDPNGYMTHHTYNVRGQPLTSQYPDGTSEAWYYTLRGTLVEHRTQQGAIHSYTHDALGNILTETVHSPNGEILSQTSHTYKGRLKTSTTDALGISTVFQYDGAGRLIKSQRGNRCETTVYDGQNRKIRQVQHYENGTQTTCWEYDALDQVVATWIEDEAGKQISRTSYQYDPLGNIIHEEVDDGDQVITIDRRYNRLGQLLSEVTGQETKHIAYEYDILVDGKAVQSKTTTDAQGNSIEEILDPAGNIDSVTHRDCDGTIVRSAHYLYDGCGQKIEQNLGAAQISWVYGPMGRLEQLIESDSRITLYEYDESGQQCAVIKPDGTRLETAYDCLKRLTRQHGPDVSYEYQYDAIGQILSAGTTCYTYSIDGDVAEETLANGLTIGYQYDELGRPELLTLPDGSTVCYKWDSLFLRSVLRRGYTHHYHTYNDRGQLARAELGNGVRYQLTFDEHDRCKQISSAPFSCLADYDAIGNLVTLTTHDPLGVFAQNFTHDPLHHVTKEEGLERHSYGYDELGNRTQCDGLPATFDRLNQEISPRLSWDENGCLKTQGNLTYHYDSLDRLVRVEGPLFALTMTYDYKHRRQTRTLYTRPSPERPLCQAERLRFFYQGDTEIGAVDGTGQICQLRVLGIGQAGDLGSAVLIELQGTSYFPMHDYRGSVTALLDARGNVVEHYRYLAFGAHHVHGTIGNPWRFASKRLDETTGLVYFGRRYYNPHAARWITPDPLGYEDGPNRYLYCHNQPLIRSDYQGYFEFHVNINFSSGGANPNFEPGSFFNHPSKLNITSSNLPKNVPVPGRLAEAISLDSLIRWYECPNYGPGVYDLKFIGRVDPPTHIYCYMNGMNCSLWDALGQARTLSNILGGWNVYLVYNETHGFVNDFAECSQNFGGNWTDPTHRLYHFWNQMMDERPNLRIMQTAFSQATLHSGLCAHAMPRDRADNLFIAALGYVIPISSHDCGASLKLASARDYVSMSYETFATYYTIRMLRDGGKLATAQGFPIFLERGTVIKPHPDAPLGDHYFDSPTYQGCLEHEVTDFAIYHGFLP